MTDLDAFKEAIADLRKLGQKTATFIYELPSDESPPPTPPSTAPLTPSGPGVKQCELRLNEKLGMVISMSGVVGNISPGTQAERLGIISGSKIESIGGHFFFFTCMPSK